jgi:perosamine synthetase
MKYLDDSINIAKKHFGYSENCPVAEEYSKKVLIIPNYYSLQESDIRYIAGCLNDGWNKIGK